MNKTECQNKLQEIKNDGIQNGIYKLAEDNKHFRSFLYRNFKEYVTGIKSARTTLRYRKDPWI